MKAAAVLGPRMALQNQRAQRCRSKENVLFCGGNNYITISVGVILMIVIVLNEKFRCYDWHSVGEGLMPETTV